MLRGRMHGSSLRALIGCQCTILCGMLLLLPKVGSGVSEIATSAQQRMQGSLPAFSEYVRPHLGEEALTPAPHEVVEIVREQQLPDFSLSPSLERDEQILQRVTEGAWPSQLTGRSPNLFLKKKHDRVPAGCEVRLSRKSVVYARCS